MFSINEFNKINESMVKVAFAFMVHLKVLHCNSKTIKLRTGKDLMFNCHS